MQHPNMTLTKLLWNFRSLPQFMVVRVMSIKQLTKSMLSSRTLTSCSACNLYHHFEYVFTDISTSMFLDSF